MNTIAAFESLYQAHLKARRGKRNRRDVIEFELQLGVQLTILRDQLLAGTYRPQRYTRFEIFDPKQRTIFALQYRDRVVQHSLCDNIVEPWMERHLIFDNAAARKGKGTHFAMDRVSQHLRSFYRQYGTSGWVLKFDVRKYYDSIDHTVLKTKLEVAFGDDQSVLALLKLFVDSYEASPGKGIPLGNQTSSWFAVWYLDGLDRLIKERLHIKYYSRYMDDGILIHQDKEYLKSCLRKLEAHLEQELQLEFNSKTQIVPLSQGFDYLGFRFYLTKSGKVVRKLRTSNKQRMKRRIKRYRHAYRTGVMDLEAINRSMAGYYGHLKHGNTWRLRQTIAGHFVLCKDTTVNQEKK